MGGCGVELERPVARGQPPRKKISRGEATFRMNFFGCPERNKFRSIRHYISHISQNNFFLEIPPKFRIQVKGKSLYTLQST